MKKNAGKPAHPDGTRLADLLREGGIFCVPLLSFPAAAHLVVHAQTAWKGTLLCVTDGPESMDRFMSDLLALRPDILKEEDIAYYPAWESLPGHGAPPHADLIGDRLKALSLLRSDHPPRWAVTCIQALMQRTRALAISPSSPPGNHILAEGQTIDPEALMLRLDALGYDAGPEVQAKGQSARRGGIVDVWPPTAAWPFRIEFFGNEIESIRTFEPVEQRSVERIGRFDLTPAREAAEAEALTGCVLDGLPDHLAWAWVDAEAIATHGALYDQTIAEANAEDVTWSYDEILARIEARANPQLRFSLADHPGQVVPGIEDPNLPVPLAGALTPDQIEHFRHTLFEAIKDRIRTGWKVRFYFDTAGTRDRFMEEFREAPGPWNAFDRPLSDSFADSSARILHLAEKDVYGRGKTLRRRYDFQHRSDGARQQIGERISSWTDIQPGDYIVHLDHGIGRYRGLFEIEFNGKRQEALTLEFADEVKLHLPVSQSHLLSRYIGAGKLRPKLHRIGGKSWTKAKADAERAVRDLAGSLLETHATRDALPGHAFSPDSVWQHEFEASFPFQETPDQHQAILDVKRDMEASRPMDRLICGDVGYGKTEVAMRASFKAVMDGKQVALLVPTTILAQQHYDTFVSRMAAFPVRIEMLSRFQTRAEQKATLERLASGGVDIVIGTHRLVQTDVAFKDLGLVIIDEEQKFGVAHKEHLKNLRKLVDVLTLTATPIPRTLYMSLTGARDLSVIETPPVERLPIETIVAENTDDIVREAVLRELNREGQIYMLHNRVQSIETARKRLLNLVPEARIAIAHGQMDEDHLARIMRAFVAGEFDLLLCTTIIESGLDIPNVNTILIERADRFGLAELYQLRGRVGRYKRRAYAYLLLPKHASLFEIARKRLTAIKRHSQLGAGFRLAMRDMEIRGAGNILGAEQSGHIAAVGFDLYCQLLRRSVAAMKGEKPPPIVDVEVKLDFIDTSPGHAHLPHTAAIPFDYMEEETQRVLLYRRIAATATPADVETLERELRDRFGRPPSGVLLLLDIARIRIEAAARRINIIEVQGDKVMMQRRGDYLMTNGKFPRLTETTPAQRLKELQSIVRKY
ncbi:MAG TPA: transcription-repair coupling factor [Kiritimatiellia bacterium]|nr:transcription-repair coupling factor [Kiritimatiellia bacterium]